jgi:hypothetical protein
VLGVVKVHVRLQLQQADVFLAALFGAEDVVDDDAVSGAGVYRDIVSIAGVVFGMLELDV